MCTVCGDIVFDNISDVFFQNKHINDDLILNPYHIIFKSRKSKIIKNKLVYEKRKYEFGEMPRNNYFRENEEKNMGDVELAVDKLLTDSINTQPHDFVSSFNAEREPKVNHTVLNVSGHYDGLTSQKAHTNDGKHKSSL